MMLPVSLAPKPVDDPDHISILMPTRGRTDKFELALNSIMETTGDPSRVDIWIYVDIDDALMLDYIKGGAHHRYPVKVNFHVDARTKTLVETTNTLWRVATDAGIYMPAGDDFLFITNGWDHLLRDAFKEYQDRILMAYSVDTTTGPDDMQFPALSAEWVNQLGYVFAGHFPFWFEDYWLDEVAQMIQRKKRVDVFMQPQGGKGKTYRMKNVPFWYRYFTNSMDDRIAIARVLRAAIHAPGSPGFLDSERRAEELCKTFWAQNKTFDDARCMGWEKNLAIKPKTHSAEYLYNYLSVEMKAVNRLVEKLEKAMKEDDDWQVLEILDNLLYASQTINDIQYLRAEYLLRAGRRAEARQALLEELLVQPRDEKSHRMLCEIEAHLPAGSEQEMLGPALAAFQRGDLETAYRHSVTLTFQYPHYAPAHFVMGASLLNQGRLPEAEESLKSTLILKSDHFEANLALGKICMVGQRYGEANAYLNAAVRLRPNEPETLAALTLMRQMMGNPEGR